MNAEIAVLKWCEFYDVIVNSAYSNTDYISALFVGDYKNYIFSRNKKNKKQMKKYDYVMYQFVMDKEFYNYIANDYNHKEEFLEDTRCYIIDMYKLYLDYKEKNKPKAIWI